MIFAGFGAQYHSKFESICFQRERCMNGMGWNMVEAQENLFALNAVLMRHLHKTTVFLKGIGKYAAWIGKP